MATYDAPDFNIVGSVKNRVGHTVGHTELGILLCIDCLLVEKLGILFIYKKQVIFMVMFLFRIRFIAVFMRFRG